MRYSKGAASLLSTAFAFQAKLLVATDSIFDLTAHKDYGTAFAPITDNTADAGILARGKELLAHARKRKK